MRKLSLTALLLFVFLGFSQENIEYQKPPEAIAELADAPLAPSVRISDDGSYMLLLYRDYYKTIAELSESELRLAGLRINPKTNIGSRTNYYNDIKIKAPKDKEANPISGLPKNVRLTNFNWSPDQLKMAFTNTTDDGVEVWVLDLEKAQAKKLTESKVNANLRDVINWFKNGKSLLVKMLPANRKELINTDEAVPTGPTISTNDGKKAQNRTYQDLLKNPNDEFNFEQLALSELYKVNLDGTKSKWKDAEMYESVSFSPDGQYVTAVTINRPFSYLVPYYRFPSTTTIYKNDGSPVHELLKVPLIEDLPKGFMAERTGMRDVSWRNDKPSTLIYAEALDGGDPENEVEFRDESLSWKHRSSGRAKASSKQKTGSGIFNGEQISWPSPMIIGGTTGIPRPMCSIRRTPQRNPEYLRIETIKMYIAIPGTSRPEETKTESRYWPWKKVKMDIYWAMGTRKTVNFPFWTRSIWNPPKKRGSTNRN